MSRLGKLPIKFGAGVQVRTEGQQIFFKGPKGELSFMINPVIAVKVGAGELIVEPQNKQHKQASALWGLVWSLVGNAVEGVSQGFTKKLEINGVGYRAAVSGRKLNLNLGYSHPIEFPLPDGVTAAVEGNVITLSGIDKGLVGETAAQIRKLRLPEPYKGKGVKYSDEVIRRKAGKSAAKGK